MGYRGFAACRPTGWLTFRFQGENVNINRLFIFIALVVMNNFAIAADGKKVYYGNCAVCHQDGKFSSPRSGYKTDWDYRLKKGIEQLYSGAIKGKGICPRKGGNAELTDDEVKAAVDYMLAAPK
jgi:cytochrome c5